MKEPVLVKPWPVWMILPTISPVGSKNSHLRFKQQRIPRGMLPVEHPDKPIDRGPSLSISITSIRIGNGGNPSGGTPAQDKGQGGGGSQKSFAKNADQSPDALQQGNPLMALVMMLLGLITNLLPGMTGQGAGASTGQ
jgi:hypothetical protein